MHRSASWNRVSDDCYMHQSSNGAPGLRLPSSVEENELPEYDPLLEMAKKEKRTKVAENAVHVIPFVLLLCGFVLWFFSNPDVAVGGIKGDNSIAAKVEGLTIDGDIDTDSDGTQTGFLPVDSLESGSHKPTKHHKNSRTRVHKIG